MSSLLRRRRAHPQHRAAAQPLARPVAVVAPKLTIFAISGVVDTVAEGIVGDFKKELTGAGLM